MRKTKKLLVLVVIAAIALVIVGLASAQIAGYQSATTNPTAAPNGAPSSGFWGWVGRCFGFSTNQPYTNPYLAPVQPAPTNTSIPVPAVPYQGSYSYGYGYSPCWARR